MSINQTNQATRVIYRRYKDGDKEVVAIFPDIPNTTVDSVTAYDSREQHCGGTLGWFKELLPVSLDDLEVMALHRELKGTGYNELAIVSAMPMNSHKRRMDYINRV